VKIAILGGGLTGLTLGYFMNRKTIDFQILEKEKECGGLMRSLQRDGFTFDCYGSHVIFSKDKEILNFMLRLLGKNKVRNKRNTKILYKGKYVKYPFENGLADLPKKDNFDCLYHFIQNLIKKEKEELKSPSNLKEWFYYIFGKGIARKYLVPYNEKLWKYPLNKMTLDWVKRIPNPPVKDILKSSLGIRTEGYIHQLYFYYPKIGGIQALIRMLEKPIKDKIITNFAVKKIKKEGKKWVVSNGNEEKLFDKIISTIPIHKLINALNSPKYIKNLARKLKYNSLITVMLGIGKQKINNLSWLYIPNKDALAHRISFPFNYSPFVVPKGSSSILAEITCRFGSDLWKMKDKDIVEIVADDLHRFKIIDKGDIYFSEVVRTKYAYIINDLNYHRRLETIKSYIKKIGIDTLGRFGEFRYLNMDACIRNVMNYMKLKTI
jgi:protoporphyrinogen oxidase